MRRGDEGAVTVRTTEDNVLWFVTGLQCAGDMRNRCTQVHDIDVVGEGIYDPCFAVITQGNGNGLQTYRNAVQQLW